MTEGPSESIQLLLDKLATASDASRLAGLLFDFYMEQPLDRFVSADRFRNNLEKFAHSSASPGLLFRHLRPAIDREAARTAARKEKLGDYLTPVARNFLEQLAGRPVKLDPQFIEGLVEQEAVRHLIRMIVEETVNRFVKSVKGDGSGILGQVGRLGIGKGLLSKLGQQLESRIQAAAATFVQGSLDRVMKNVVHTVSSEEMSGELGRLNQEGFRAALKLRTSSLWAKLVKQPWDDLFGLIPDLLRHNLARKTVADAIAHEVAAVLAAEKSKTLREIIDDDELVSYWRAESSEVGGLLLSDFARTPGFRKWLEDT
jgi:hypothetical protein